MRKVMEILTPENVLLEYELAGLGSRFAALLIDHLLQGILVLVAGIAVFAGGVDLHVLGGYNKMVIAAGIVLVFIIIFGYFVFFEMLMGGQTPGKKIFGLKVVKQSGEPIGFIESFLRNILRIPDLLPMNYLAGSLFIFFSKQYKRIGDYAANTIVIKVKKHEKFISLESLLNRSEAGDEETKLVNQYPVNNSEYNILKEFFARSGQLGAREEVFSYHLAKYFMEKFNMKPPLQSHGYANSQKYLEDIMKNNAGV